MVKLVIRIESDAYEAFKLLAQGKYEVCGYDDYFAKSFVERIIGEHLNDKMSDTRMELNRLRSIKAKNKSIKQKESRSAKNKKERESSSALCNKTIDTKANIRN